VSFLVAIEGADGAGKATAAAHVREALLTQGHTACVISFPRYGQTAGGFAIGDFLSGRTPVPVSPKAAAVLYALDRLESLDVVEAASASHDVIIFDRYIASNMVYQAAKVKAAEARAMMDWIFALETKTFGVTPPDLSIYLDTPVSHARKLILQKHRRSYTDRAYDEHEADLALQKQVRTNYSLLASTNVLSPWHIVSTAVGKVMRAPSDISEEIVRRILRYLKSQGSEAKLSKMMPSA